MGGVGLYGRPWVGMLLVIRRGERGVDGWSGPSWSPVGGDAAGDP